MAGILINIGVARLAGVSTSFWRPGGLISVLLSGRFGVLATPAWRAVRVSGAGTLIEVVGARSDVDLHARGNVFHKRVAHPSEWPIFLPYLNFYTIYQHHNTRNQLKLLRIRFFIHFHVLLTRASVVSCFATGAAVPWTCCSPPRTTTPRAHFLP